jgi:hypothetical protein
MVKSVRAWEALYPGAYRTNLDALEFFSDPLVLLAKQDVISAGLPSLFPHIPVEELTAIRYYTTNAYGPLNTALRGTPEAKHLGFEELLNNGLSKLTPYDGGNVQRGVYGVEADIAKTWNPGDDITFKDFKSSSTDADVAYDFSIGNSGNVVYEISNPIAYDICGISCLPGEAEVLFKSKSKFRVTAVDLDFVVDYGGVPTTIRKIYMEYVP